MNLSFEEPSPPEPESDRPSVIGGSTRFVPGQNNDRVTVVNGKVQLAQRMSDLWRNRELLVLLTRSELKVKYKSSILGYLWSMLNPALVLAVYYGIFKIISRTPQPHFAIWLFSGLLVWNLFNNAAMSATGVVVSKAGIVKKVAFPRELLALSVVGVAMVLFAIQIVVLVLALALFGIKPDFSYMPDVALALVCLIIFTSAVSIFLSAVNVYLRDTQHLTEVLLMAWFWGTPIVYTWGTISTTLAAHLGHHHLLWMKWLYLTNPVAPIAMTFQRAIYGADQYPLTNPINGAVTHTQVLPSWGPADYGMILGIVFVASTVLFLLSLIVFGRLEGNFAEEL